MAMIHPETDLGPVELTVTSLERSMRLYADVLGLVARDLGGAERAVTLSAGGDPLLVLYEHAEARPRPARSTGLYHVALLLPTRRDLARTLAQLARTGYPLTGASDHRVSEALYLNDPDGNGLEIYADRPRTAWPRVGNEVRMTVDPLDANGLLAELDTAPWAGLPAGTVVGHIHLHVRDLGEAATFYGEVLGFALMQRFTGALFMAAGGYHHHLGLNTWAGAGAPPPPPDAVGLRRFTVRLPDGEALEAVAGRLRDAGVAHERRADGLHMRDPSQNALLLCAR